MRGETPLAAPARRLNRRSGRGGPWLALLTDLPRLPDPRPLLPRLPPGALVILRHPDPALRAGLAAATLPACRARRLRLVIADDFALAVRHRAGLHLPERAARTAGARVRRWQRAGGPLTVAAHSRLALVRARGLGADAALLSPVFPTLGHGHARSLGLHAFRRLTRRAALPVLALGGVDRSAVRPLLSSRAAGIAAVGGIAAAGRRQTAPNPRDSA